MNSHVVWECSLGDILKSTKSLIVEWNWLQRPGGPYWLAEESFPPKVYWKQKLEEIEIIFFRYLTLIARKSRFYEEKWGDFADEQNYTDDFS